ncbi:CDP-diacylglycerol--glycerol-3-phosphate 3-phosphatidyltransferase [Dethiosulfatibacter aminovorans DSM 17477]|uniref:CDP-diacylglycerol--glycerol-3-phosphate 3-phosphatidyltransferase n=1 Tax=Dethiosulfatibacter aminovorans DSM 17477 TaxID=1121476 RepID=A0A1M6KV86_9FIRM|nr:CDP-diacylglycerol--glycerol-3-phosphate 3-phosphatidyltransferase [Dethiosulfatibacter aminovorans]SHJ62810.1 CDP-diacylglycerol--glycerol-3-phosphate 3-phosphatidyltransferase [Dethiosulfatibacter aminovorans DSM 17477]
MKNIPNILTIFRIILAPVFVVVFFSGKENAYNLALVVYVLASFTDFLDGYLARRYNLITELGKVLDPFADKVMLITVLICLYIWGRIPLVIPVVVVVKELFMIVSGLILYLRKERMVIPSNIFGKSATVIFMLSIMLLMLYPDNDNLVYLLYLAVLVKIIAFISYRITYVRNKKAAN